MYFAQSQNVFCSKAKCILPIPPSHKLDIDFHPALVYWYTIIQNVSVKYFECFVKCVFLIMSLVCYVVFFLNIWRELFSKICCTRAREPFPTQLLSITPPPICWKTHDENKAGIFSGKYTMCHRLCLNIFRV